jgi:HAD superfamily phosphatase (TIGR01668 family)
LSFKAGSFDREGLPGAVRPFCPSHAVHRLQDVNLEGLKARGKTVILIDVDNTLVKWRTEDFEDHTLAWLAEAKALGFNVAIISNTRNVERLARLSEKLGVKTMRGRFKPSRVMFKQALAAFGAEPKDAIMIGDQLFTDVFGANRAGVESVWLQPISNTDLITTKFNRMLERGLRGYLYRALTEPPDATPADPVEESQKPFRERKVVRQFVKFCIVGGTSFILDYSVNMTLLYGIQSQGGPLGETFGNWLISQYPAVFGFADKPEAAAMPIFATMGASVGIVNSFIWNRFWTFKIRGAEQRMEQFRKFVFVSVIGLTLNVLLRSLFFHLLPGGSKSSARIAFVLAAGIVAFWNFTGQRIYAFRQKA